MRKHCEEGVWLCGACEQLVCMRCVSRFDFYWLMRRQDLGAFKKRQQTSGKLQQDKENSAIRPLLKH
jgi:hypothetical protein